MFLSITALVAFVEPTAITAAVAETCYVVVPVTISQVMLGAVSIMDKFSRLTIRDKVSNAAGAEYVDGTKLLSTRLPNSTDGIVLL